MIRKRISFALAVMLVFSLCIPCLTADAFAETGAEMRYVADTYGLLSFDERTALEKQAERISKQYGCGVYIVTVADYASYGTGDVLTVAAQIYHYSDAGFGVGDGRDGIMLLLSMVDRDYALYVYGERAEYAFNDYGLERLEDAFLGDLGRNNWFGGLSGYLSACEEYLARAGEGRPVQASPVGPILVSVVISCCLALMVCAVMANQMKTIHKKSEARAYVTAGGLRLTRQVDQYTHTTQMRRKIQSSSGGTRGGVGGIGGFGGGGGRSGKF